MKFKFNQKLLMDAIIAGLIVQMSPGLLNDFVFKSNPLSGIALTAAGAGAGVAAGMLLKKPDIVTLSLALGALDVVSDLIGTTLLGSTKTNIQDFVTAQQNGQLQLRDYTNLPSVMRPDVYADAYANN